MPTVSTIPSNGTASANSAIRRLEADEGGADQARRGPEVGAHDAHLVPHRTHRPAPHPPPRRRGDVSPGGAADPAAEHDQPGLEDVRERAHRRAEMVSDVGEDLESLFVALVRESHEPV